MSTVVSMEISMEMKRIMVVVVHPDQDAKKLTDSWHL